jgi:hypothetical protein
MSRAMAGAGKMFTDLGHGVKQLTSKDQDYAGEAERAKLDEPLMHTGMGMGGYLGASSLSLALPGAALGGLAKAVLPAAGAVATYGPGALSSAALSALSPTTEEGQRAKNMALGSAISPVLQKTGDVVSRALTPVTQWIGDNVSIPLGMLKKSFNAEASPTDKQSVARAVMADIPVYPHQLEKPGQQLLTAAQAEGQKDAFTRAVNRTMGQETGDIPGAISAAHSKLGDTYNTILNGLQVPLDKNLGSRAAQVQANYLQATKLRAPNSDLDDAIERLTSQIQQGGTLTGRQLQDALQGYAADAVAASRSGMFKGQPTGKPDHAAAQAFRDLSDMLESHASQFMRPGDAQVFKQTNKQWRNMKTLEQVAPVANGVEDYAPTALARKLKQSDSKSFLYNQGDPELSDLSKFGTKYMGMDANAPTSWTERMKQSAIQAAPILAGDALGGYVAGRAAGANDPGQGDNVAEDMIKYAAGAYLAHHALAHARQASNPRIDLNWLNQPRGALAELTRRATMTQGVVGALSTSHNANAAPPSIELRGMAGKAE